MLIREAESLKICFVIPLDLVNEDGGRTHTLEFVNKWSDLGHEVFLFSGDISNKSDFHFAQHVRIPRLRIKGLIGISYSLCASIFMIFYYFRYRFDIIYERKMFISPTVLFARMMKLPIVIELNDLPPSMNVQKYFKKESNVIKRTVLKALLFWLVLDGAIAAKLATKIILTAKLNIPAIEQRNPYLLPFGANSDLFKPFDKTACRCALNLQEQMNIICFVGSFLPWQGIEHMLDAMPTILHELPETLLLLIGDEEPSIRSSRECKTSTKARIENLDLAGNVVRTGRVPYELVHRYLSASDVCIIAQTSARSGYSPLKLFEYMACAKPVIATDIIGIREIVTESHCGILVPPENSDKLAQAAITILKDSELMTELGRNGRISVLAKYNWESVARGALGVCEEAIERIKTQ